MFGGSVPGLFCELEDERRMVPKFFLITFNPELFREGGWPALIDLDMPWLPPRSCGFKPPGIEAKTNRRVTYSNCGENELRLQGCTLFLWKGKSI